jgi:hypothetical protein
MSQPPYPPQGGNDPGGERSGPQDWDPEAGADDPTRTFDAPGAGAQRNATQQFGQPEYGQPEYGQAPYGQPPHPQYGQSPYPPPQYPQAPYGQPPYGQPPYGQPPYGQPPYGQPPYGQPQYGQPPYGQPPYGQPWGSPGGPGAQRPTKSRNTVIALVVGAVVLLAAIAVGLFFLLRAGEPGPQASASGGSSSASAPSEPAPTDERGIPGATVTPDGLGDDPDLDELAQECYDGDMDSCDRLYEEADLDSLYGLYGGTCAGRQDVSDADTVFCADAFPEN